MYNANKQFGGSLDMNNSAQWNQTWERKSRGNFSDFELDHGASPRDQETESLSWQEHLRFVNPQPHEVLLDAGCGTGVDIIRIHSLVKKIIGLDFSSGSLERCKKNLAAHEVRNADVYLASIMNIPLPDHSVDKAVCLSVLQYLDDEEVRLGLRELARVVKPGGTLILHVKNSASLYWSTLRIAKEFKRFLGRATELYNLRSFKWYVAELMAVNCRVVAYESMNVLSLDPMPIWAMHALQKVELKYHYGRIFTSSLVRRSGADLKLRAVAG